MHKLIYPINNNIHKVPNGTVILSVPFTEIASIAVIAKPISADTNGQCGVAQNSTWCQNAKYPPIKIVDIANIVTDPATDFLVSLNLYFLLLIILPNNPANPSPYAIIRFGINPNDGTLYIPNETITNIKSEIA